MGRSLTVVVAALNEERHVEATVKAALEVGDRYFHDVEVIIVDDGSTDRTADIADGLAAADERVHAIHHPTPTGLGGAFAAGLERATGAQLILLNGKNDTPTDALDKILSYRDAADLVVPYTLNCEERPLHRRLMTFGLSLRYYNHSVLYRTDQLRDVELKTRSYAYGAELLVKLLRRGSSFVEVGVVDLFDPNRRTRAFKPANIAGVARFYIDTLRDVRRRG